LQADREALAVARELDRIHLAMNMIGGQLHLAVAGPRLEKFFQQKGFEVRNGDLAKLAETMRHSPARFAWVAALDHWASVVQLRGASKQQKGLLPRLLELARRADPEPWRDRVRDPGADVRALEELARQVDVSQQSPHILLALAFKLKVGGARRQLLERALRVYPADFWLHYDRGSFAEEPAERQSFFRTALALRPDNALVHFNLGFTLLRQAIHNPRLLLLGKKDWELGQAIDYLRKAIDLDADVAMYHAYLGRALVWKKDYDRAITCCKKAIELEPKIADYHGDLGTARERKAQSLIAQGNLVEAEKLYDQVTYAYRQALKLSSSKKDRQVYQALLENCEKIKWRLHKAARR
jgi:tetratricopeptide (TPR) repeat protein